MFLYAELSAFCNISRSFFAIYIWEHQIFPKCLTYQHAIAGISYILIYLMSKYICAKFYFVVIENGIYYQKLI